METRVLIAYALIALMVTAIAYVIRRERRERARRRQGRRRWSRQR